MIIERVGGWNRIGIEPKIYDRKEGREGHHSKQRRPGSSAKTEKDEEKIKRTLLYSGATRNKSSWKGGKKGNSASGKWSGGRRVQKQEAKREGRVDPGPEKESEGQNFFQEPEQL